MVSSDMIAVLLTRQGLVHTNSQPIREQAGEKQQGKGRAGERGTSDEKAREKVKSHQCRGETKQRGEQG